jgi:serine/threonine protein kinase
MIGKTLGHYRVGEPLGRGGMGEVYVADDLNLNRKVALKSLPDAFADDPERMARFEREARLLASLNQHNIAAIYGLEQAEGKRFIVMELVEGETLAQRISKGALPVDEALAICRQMAEGLEAAHEKGVIHRDLKPANVMITEGDKVKILDFGLAKALSDETQTVDSSQSPTLTEAMTRPGIILGTAAYMSPEQAKGKAVDRRADIWAFGCILYECLTGKRAFEGETVTETLAAILKGEPDWNRLAPNLHPRIRLLLERCLEKETRNRYGSINDARVDIQKALSDPGGALVQAGRTEPGRKLRQMLAWVAAAVVLTAIISAITIGKLRPMPSNEPRHVMRFEYDLPADQQIVILGHPFLAISPDGSKFVYNTSGGFYLRSMDQSNPRLILGADKDPRQPFFSRDGQWVGYWSGAENQIKKISINGGAPVTLTNTGGNPVLASWSADDTIVYGQFGTGKIMRVPASGGAPELLCETQGNLIFAPQILPGGEWVLFSQMDGPEYRVMVQSLKTGQRKTLMPMQGTVSRYLPTGHLVYTIGNNLFAAPFDLHRFEITGSPVLMIEGILWTGTTAAPQYAISDSGTLAYVMGTVSPAALGRTLVWVNREGKEEPVAAPPNLYNHPKVSPDGTQVAFTANIGGNIDIYVFDLLRRILTRLTFDKSQELHPIWTPDGKRIVYASNRDGYYDIYWKAADGTGKDEKLVSAPDRQRLPCAFSRDGKSLITAEATSGLVTWEIGILSTEGDHSHKPLLHEDNRVVQPKVSPDGRWIAYTSNDLANNTVEVYVRPFPEVDKGRWQVSTGGGHSPLWSPDGRELFFRNGDAVMAVPVKTNPSFRFETPKILFRGTYLSPVFLSGDWTFAAWDISTDGKRFLMIKESGAATPAAAGPRKINIVVNWTEELKQRVPVK